ncbi:MAG: PD-(D/E)XK nuclease family protein [Chloroflexota bacterium]
MPLPEDFRFTQSVLADYTDCARRFELRYIQRLRWPAPVAEPVREYEAHMQRGADFHRMVHQHHLGIPAAAIAAQAGDTDLRLWWAAYLNSEFVYNGPLAGDRYPETLVAAQIDGRRLAAKFDLVIDGGDVVTIIDWKTSNRRTPDHVLARRWQTLLYRYVLVEAGRALLGRSVAPQQVTMVYWFAADPGNPARFDYDAAQHADTADALRAVLAEIDARATFELTDDVRRCAYCIYRSLCDRGSAAGGLDDFDAISEDADTDDLPPDFDLDIDLDQVAEVEF